MACYNLDAEDGNHTTAAMLHFRGSSKGMARVKTAFSEA